MGESNLYIRHGMWGMQSQIADECVPGFWVENRSTHVRLNNTIAAWLAARLDGYKVSHGAGKREDWDYDRDGVEVFISDPKVAMMFKLMWSGR
jgi:hypothetical protein